MDEVTVVVQIRELLRKGEGHMTVVEEVLNLDRNDDGMWSATDGKTVGLGRTFPAAVLNWLTNELLRKGANDGQA